MGQYHLHFYKIDPKKTAVCFTFDDNFPRHSELIAPAFLQRGFRCTFYVNPGTQDFLSRHQQRYGELFKQGFEIGSHGYVHDNLSELSAVEAENNLREAAQRIESCFHVYPSTFAFPYHNYNHDTLTMARSLHLETRNTLTDSKWFAIKTAIPLGDMLTATESCIAEKRPLVFSGHSVMLSPKEADDERLKNEIGYNPILLDDLYTLLDFIKQRSEHVQVLTFEQASLLAYIKKHGEVNADSFTLSKEHMDSLKVFGIDRKRLLDLM